LYTGFWHDLTSRRCTVHYVQCVVVLETYGKLREQMANKRSVSVTLIILLHVTKCSLKV